MGGLIEAGDVKLRARGLVGREALSVQIERACLRVAGDGWGRRPRHGTALWFAATALHLRA